MEEERKKEIENIIADVSAKIKNLEKKVAKDKRTRRMGGGLKRKG